MTGLRRPRPRTAPPTRCKIAPPGLHTSNDDLYIHEAFDNGVKLRLFTRTDIVQSIRQAGAYIGRSEYLDRNGTNILEANYKVTDLGEHEEENFASKRVEGLHNPQKTSQDVEKRRLRAELEMIGRTNRLTESVKHALLDKNVADFKTQEECSRSLKFLSKSIGLGLKSFLLERKGERICFQQGAEILAGIIQRKITHYVYSHFCLWHFNTIKLRVEEEVSSQKSTAASLLCQTCYQIETRKLNKRAKNFIRTFRRLNAKIRRRERRKAAKKIQKYVRGFLGRLRYIFLRRTVGALKLQTIYRGFISRKKNDAAKRIQAVTRIYLLRKHAVLRIENFYDRVKFWKTRNGFKRLQAVKRGIKAREIHRKIWHIKRSACIIIQKTICRGNKGREIAHNRRRLLAAIMIQSFERQRVCRCYLLFALSKCLKIQSFYRCMRFKLLYKRMKCENRRFRKRKYLLRQKGLHISSYSYIVRIWDRGLKYENGNQIVESSGAVNEMMSRMKRERRIGRFERKYNILSGRHPCAVARSKLREEMCQFKPNCISFQLYSPNSRDPYSYFNAKKVDFVHFLVLSREKGIRLLETEITDLETIRIFKEFPIHGVDSITIKARLLELSMLKPLQKVFLCPGMFDLVLRHFQHCWKKPMIVASPVVGLFSRVGRVLEKFGYSIPTYSHKMRYLCETRGVITIYELHGDISIVLFDYSIGNYLVCERSRVEIQQILNYVLKVDAKFEILANKFKFVQWIKQEIIIIGNDLTFERRLRLAVHKISTLWREKQEYIRKMNEIKADIKKLYDPVSRCHFYLIESTGETTWTKPAVLGDGDVEEVKRALWEEYVSDETGETYYYNTRTGATTWLSQDEATVILQRAYRERLSTNPTHSKLRLDLKMMAKGLRFMHSVKIKFINDPEKLSACINYALVQFSIHGRRDEVRGIISRLLDEHGNNPIVLILTLIFNLSIQKNEDPCLDDKLRNEPEKVSVHVLMKELFQKCVTLRRKILKVDPKKKTFELAKDAIFKFSLILDPESPEKNLNFALIHHWIYTEPLKALFFYKRALICCELKQQQITAPEGIKDAHLNHIALVIKLNMGKLRNDYPIRLKNR